MSLPAVLAESPEPQQLLTALAMFDELGVRLLATKVRRRLCALGVTRIPHGSVDDTRVNPVGLTIREAATHTAELGALDAQDR